MHVTFAEVLSGTWASDVPLGEKRRCGAAAHTVEPETFDGFEEAMSFVRLRFGDIGVSAAVKRLRASAHVGLACRCRRASTRRNRLAHLDPGLAREILALGEEAVAEQATDADGIIVTECTSSTVSGCWCTLFDIYDTKCDTGA